MRRLSALAPITIAFLLGSVECSAQSATAETSSPLILPANTPVILHLTKSLYKKDAKPGQPVEFEVVFDVVVNGQVVIKNGTAVIGSVRQIDPTGKGPAKVLIDLGPAQSISGEMVRLAAPGSTTDDASLGRPRLKDVGGLVAFDPEVLPALPVILPVLAVMELFPGKKVLLHKNMEVFARVAENVALDAAKLKAAQAQLTPANTDTCLMWFYYAAAQGPQHESLRDGEVNASGARSRCSILLTAERLSEARDLDGAIDQYQQLLALKPEFPAPAELHLRIAELFREKRDFVHAIPEYRTAVQLDPKDELSRIGLINALEDSGDLDAALAESKEAIRSWPGKNAYFHYLLGRVLVKKNDPDAAIVELQWALKEGKNHLSPANCELGRAYELKGDLEAALGQYRTAFRAHGGDKECQAAYERLHQQLKK